MANLSTKGQLISKGLFGFSIIPKNKQKNSAPVAGEKIKILSLFFGRIEDTKISFRD